MRTRSSRAPYVYPLGRHASIGRIDQGQDFGGTGAIVAIGRSRVEKVTYRDPGWEGGQTMLLRLLDGPLRGAYYYVNEGVTPAVRRGQIVEAGQKIGELIPGSTSGIEIGWAQASGEPVSHPGYTEGKKTTGGKTMAGFLAGLAGSGKPSRGSAQGGETEIPGVTPAAKFLEENVPGFKAAADAYNSLVTEPVEGLAGDAAGFFGHKASGVADEVISGILGDLAKSAEPLMVNIGLLFGGAFLIYYGTALVFGIKAPVKVPLKVPLAP
jgi:hypothetical protein